MDKITCVLIQYTHVCMYYQPCTVHSAILLLRWQLFLLLLHIHDYDVAIDFVHAEFTSPDKSASFFCKVYYAKEFRELRELIFPSGEERCVC